MAENALQNVDDLRQNLAEYEIQLQEVGASSGATSAVD
jgi:phage-related minor tail protein